VLVVLVLRKSEKTLLSGLLVVMAVQDYSGTTMEMTTTGLVEVVVLLTTVKRVMVVQAAVVLGLGGVLLVLLREQPARVVPVVAQLIAEVQPPSVVLMVAQVEQILVVVALQRMGLVVLG
jgi:hypothetical protein